MSKAAAEHKPPGRDLPCPCGTGKTFGACCEPILSQREKAPDAERLMRSRFSAHVARDFAHLHRTYLPTSKEPYVPDGEAGGTDWTRLVIHSHTLGPKDGFAYVDFTAYFKEGDAERALLEKAEFQLIDGTWFYTRPVRQGPAPIKAGQAKVGRNDPCPCGSGKKHKQCCQGKRE